MSIKKLLLLASMALAAIAFAAPAVAQAEVTLTEDEVPLQASEHGQQAGAEITATSTDLTTRQTNQEGEVVGVLTCNLVTLHFEVITNGQEHVLLKQLGLATTSGCLANGTLPVTIENGGLVPTEEEHRTLTIDTWGTANATSTFVSNVYLDEEHTMLAQSCDYEGDLHIVGKGSGNDLIEITESTLTAPECPLAHIEGTFTLETETGKRVDLDYVETT